MEIKNVEDIYPLTPAQQSIFLLNNPTVESGIYCHQISLLLQGELDLSVFELTWQSLIDHYSSLRASYVWKRVDNPLQLIRKIVKFAYQQLDWQDLPALQQQEHINDYLSSVRLQGINPAQAPLMRFALCRLAKDRYQFIFTFHSLLLDLISGYAVLKEFFIRYETLYHKSSQDWMERRPYSDLISWLKQQDLSIAGEHWKAVLKDTPKPATLITELFNNNLAQSAQNDEQHEVAIVLSAALTTKLETFIQEHKFSLTTVAQAVWALLLKRYRGEEESIIGINIDIRPINLERAETILGPFQNLVPLRVKISASSTVLELLNQIQQQRDQLAPYDYCSAVQIQEWSGLTKYRPFFDTAVSCEHFYSNSELQFNEFSELKVEKIKSYSQSTLPLAFTLVAGQPMSLRINYQQRYFDRSTVNQMLGHLEVLLAGMANLPNESVDRLPLLTPSELTQLQSWNDTRADYQEELCAQTLFERQAANRPDAIAAIYLDEQISYGELNRRANQLAHHLRSMGIGPEVMVGICMERSIEMLVAILGTLKAGGAYVPLDPAYPLERLVFMIEDAQILVLLTQERLLDQLPSHYGQVICLDADWQMVAWGSEENPDNLAQADNMAYVIYTSGSTGRPKGVMVSHRGLVNLWEVQTRDFHLGSDSRLLQLVSPSFDAAVFDITGALFSGGTLYLEKQESLLPGLGLVKLMREKQISFISIPASVLAVLPFDELPALRTIHVGGDASQADIISRWALDREVINAYGPAEATVVTTIAPFAGEYPHNSRKPVIGKPINNAQVFILDENLQQVPVGVSGELYIAGVGLTRGYLNNPILTAERFIPNPFSEKGGERLYRTGDLARYLPDGNIDFVGRADSQVKIRGFRVELGEIETIISRHPAVQQVVVNVFEHEPGDKRLVAYIVSILNVDWDDVEEIEEGFNTSAPRTHPLRLPVDIETKVTIEENKTFQVTTKFISLYGLGLIDVPGDWEQGKELQLTLQLPGVAEPLEVSGQIRWNRQGRAGVKLYDTPKSESLLQQSLDQIIETHNLSFRHWINFLQGKLPNFMIPTAFVLLDKMPLTPNGKVDRKALPPPETSRATRSTNYVEPQTELDKKIAQIWQEELKIDKVGLNDNFFDLGGHSLLMVQVAGRLEALLNRELPVIELFKYPTISSLAAYLNQPEKEDLSLEEVRKQSIDRKKLIHQQRQNLKELKNLHR